MSFAGYTSRTPEVNHGNEERSGHPRGGRLMIARIWRGAVRIADGDAYARYMEDTGLAGYKSTPGNLSALMLRRDVGDRTEFVMFTTWESMDAIKAFAGDDPERAVYYPKDDQFLIEKGPTVAHYQVTDHDR
jgi:heme-degrading monooxygenase HmoA